ncbi:hybrid sensor histidine kinase/response regulator [Telluria aromaticivorans]|uniref:histidine kinase n=1 Tax=Telluria aromaticivorans TaxID=2725995 RepID=A0A7Y2JVY3_9BURK|nr:ATP-binding protein [Telluria aromaticivorans]NNG21550.1 hybrid sensor histidine kinase/response regulator [Telluria aromaticivorans]
MIPFELVSIFIDLQGPDERLAATDRLARYAGVAQVLVFSKDAELGIFLPALGLPQTLRCGRRWQAFLQHCADAGNAHSSLPSAGNESDLPAWGHCDSTGTAIVVFLGTQPEAPVRAAIAALLPLLSAKLAGERSELAAAGLAAAARDSNRRASQLNNALDASRRELQAAYQLVENELVSRREAEARLRDTDRRKDEFLAMLAHELRNPLAPIGMAAQILRVGTVTPARLKQTCEIIDRQIGHMTSLLDDLLDVSRVTGGLVALAQERHEMGGIVRDAVEQARPLVDMRRQRLSLTLSAQAAQVVGDGTRLVQILTNLLNNASKYTPQGGVIELELTQDATMVHIVVRDNGIGIDAALLPHVFDLFVQGERSPDRAQGGLGLGLALVRALVERHGGSVSAASRGPGSGSEFTLRLPLAQGAEPVPAAREPGGAACERGMDILIVDDNADAADMLSMFLSTVGHQLRVAYEGSSALALAAQAPPDILLLDIGLPDIDGYEVARQVRALPQAAHATLIALTGYGQPADRERSIAAGFNHHLTKPVDAAALLRLLATVSKQTA